MEEEIDNFRKDLGTPMEKTSNNHGRDTLVLTCNEDGIKLDEFYIDHKKKTYKTITSKLTGKKIKVVEDSGISGMNNSIMKKWADWFVSQKK
jgi:hypothetical protein